MAFVVGSSSSGYRVKLYWSAPDVNDLIDDGYDLWKVEYGISWSSIAPQSAWSPMIRDMTEYVYHHSVIDPVLLNYRAVPVRSSDLSEGTIIPVVADHAGYCSLQDVRAAGYTAPTYTDEAVLAAINKASSMIDRICRQWFEPRYMNVSLNGRDHDKLFLSMPIVAVMQVLIDDQVQDLSSFMVYNRHLTHGIVNPDDRANPMIAWGDARTNLDIRRLFGGGTFARARKTITVKGIFGYTDLGVGFSGETSLRSQIPLSYGETPSPLVRACLLLTIKNMIPLEDAEEMEMAGRVEQEKTRDQTYKLGERSEADNSYGMTGLLEVDKVLMMYPPPFDLVGV